MSKIAEKFSPNSAPDRTKSGNTTKNQTEEEKSVEELLEEAEKLVRENTSMSKSSSRSEIFVSNSHEKSDTSRVRKLENDIFHIIEQTSEEKSRKKNSKKRTESPGFEIVYENMNAVLKTPKSLEHQKKKFEEQKVQVSSSSDLDDPIERHSVSDDKKNDDKSCEDEENLQKELTDADKDFFDGLLRRSRQKIEGGISESPSFDQEDFSHFIKILERKSEAQDPNYKKNNPLKNEENNSTYPEEEITEILEKELKKINNNSKNQHEFMDSDSSSSKIEKIPSKIDSTYSKNSIKSTTKIDKNNLNKGEIIKVSNSQNDLYTVGLTPRLELFADAIPKLIAEKTSVESPKVELNINKVNEKEKDKNFKFDNKDILDLLPLNLNDKKIHASRGLTTSNKSSKFEGKKMMKRSDSLEPSKSYDHLPKPSTSFRSSLDDLRSTKSADVRKKSNLSSKNYSKSQLLTKSISTIASKVKFSVKPTPQKQPVKTRGNNSDVFVKQSLMNVEMRKNYTKQDFELLYQEERHKNSLLRDQINAEEKLYKQQIQSMRTSFEEELFSLKKQNIIQKAKIDELILNPGDDNKKIKISESNSDTRVMLFEKEMERQESVIRTYENENKKLMIETKKLQEELKIINNKETSKDVKKISDDENKIEKLKDTICDLKEEILKLNIELTELRTKNSDLTMKNDDSLQQSSLLQEELTMFKQQLITKDKFITERLKSMSIHEMETRRKMEELKIELTTKTEKLKLTKCEFDKFQQAIIPLENELIELRQNEKLYIEKLQLSKTHVDREKVLTQKLKDQVILDNKKILDLNRQVREMERILKRKNPDSVSALILTAKSDNERLNIEKVKLLEDRIASLEAENKANELINQEKLTKIQSKFGEMKEKYEIQVVELEDKLSKSLIKDIKVFNDMSCQTIEKSVESKLVEAKEKSAITTEKEDKKIIKIGPKSQNIKEDTHLVATIRGLQLELTNKDKTLLKLTKEIQEIQKTNRRLQKEREKLLNDRRNYRTDDKTIRPVSVHKTTETNDQNSNVYHNGNGNITNLNGETNSLSTQKLYDPLQYSENGDFIDVKKIKNENEILKDEIDKIKKDFMTLKNRRLHDLNILQEEHEREMENLVKEYSVKFCDSKVIKLQGQINTQASIISHLKSQMEKLRDHKEQVVVLKVEREHLENKVKILNEKIKYLTTPETEQLQLLQDKILILQQRHESRESTLQNLIRDLLRNKIQCFDCKGQKSKNKQLCYYRQELDNILVMLQEIANIN